MTQKSFQTQLQLAQAGCLSANMRQAAEQEGCAAERLCSLIASGKAVIPSNPAHKGLCPIVVGRHFKTKINANIGRSMMRSTLEQELQKLHTAIDAGADCVMDLSVGENITALRQALLEACSVPFGTVPIYEAISRLGGRVAQFNPTVLFDVITEQAEQGVDFMTLHAGLLRSYVPLAQNRRAGIVSRGGAILAQWMSEKQKENPLYENWNKILKVCRKHDVTVSLGDGLRPGCIEDAGDSAQFAELETLGELVRSCREAGVQVMVEGPGHVPFDQVKDQVDRALRVCEDAPFYVLGPVVTDIAPGYDHITAAIGATAAASAGAALLCYVTPAEHLGLPDENEVREGIIAFKIAAHAADLAKKLPGALERDNAMTDARVTFNWKRQFELALDPAGAEERFKAKMENQEAVTADHCSMCGAEFCAMRISANIQKHNS